MDGNQTREGITADLKLSNVWASAVCSSWKWMWAFPKAGQVHESGMAGAFRHANAEAARLGLVMTMPASPGGRAAADHG